MPKIVTTSDLQKHIGKLLQWVSHAYVIVTNRGRAQLVMLPYFEGNDNAIEAYLEEYEMHQNAEKLREELQASYESGSSNLVI